MKTFVCLLVCILMLSTACSKGDKPQGTILAKVNGEYLTLEELLLQVPPEMRSQLTPDRIQEAVESWINAEVLSQKGIELGVDKDEAVQSIIKIASRDAIARHYLDQQLAQVQPLSPAAVDSVYTMQKESYRLPQSRLRASHILVQTEDEALAIHSRLKKGDDFGRLADEYSKDRQSAAAGGDIGYFNTDQIDPDFGKAADKLAIGQYSGPVKSGYGYHLIKLTERLNAGEMLDSMEAKKQIFDSLYVTRQNQAINNIVEGLKSDASIERFPLPSQAPPAAQDTE